MLFVLPSPESDVLVAAAHASAARMTRRKLPSSAFFTPSSLHPRASSARVMLGSLSIPSRSFGSELTPSKSDPSPT